MIFQIYSVLIDGNFVGFIRFDDAALIEKRLRYAKVSVGDSRVPYVSEIVLVKRSPDPINIQGQYPGLYIFTDPARLIRPIRNLKLNRTEYIGRNFSVYEIFAYFIIN